jgi:hypothetical protein
VRSKARDTWDDAGKVVAYVSSVEDVTDAKVLREALAAKQQRLADILEGTGPGMCRVRELVELHGGDVDVVSALGQVTTVAPW